MDWISIIQMAFSGGVVAGIVEVFAAASRERLGDIVTF